MAFPDPQSITINAVANSLPRTGSGIGSGIFTKDDGLLTLTVNHRGGNSTGGKRFQRRIRFDHSKVAANPFDSSINAKYGMSVSLIVDVGPVGYTIVEQKQIIDGFIAALNATSGANITRLLGGES